MSVSANSIDTDERRELEREGRLEAPLAVLLVVCLQASVAFLSLENGWQLWTFSWWIWLLPIGIEIALIVPLASGLVPVRRRRPIAIAIASAIGLINVFTLTLLLGSIATAHENSGGQLLIKAATVWVTNVVFWGIVYWELDAGGPLQRRLDPDRRRDFQFPTVGQPGWERWQPHLIDYLYVASTNALVFSPTDAMPLSRQAKVAMLVQGGISAVAVLLVVSRAVGII